jgi:hypothetical protein
VQPKHRFITAAVATALLAAMLPAGAETVDVVVQAGHEGRPASCAPNHVRACNIGASSPAGREIVWTPIVADAITAALRAAGFRVARRAADYPQHDTARIAIFIHFDGSDPPCASGTSVGFPATTSHEFVAAWEAAYRRLYPFRFVGENISSNEEQYYGFHKVVAPQKMLIEYGELTCPAQAKWLAPRLQQLGAFTARFLIGQLR